MSPQSISVATASARLDRQEGLLLKSTIGHSIAMALVVSIVTLILAYLAPALLK
ncbi:MAG TPA: L-lactate permease [Spirochaetia bacterium]|nr:L-lactate permease [Spirochaetia bacterium]